MILLVSPAAMTPRSELASTGFCLAEPGKEYLVYLPDGGEATVDLASVSGPVTVEWLNPRTGDVVEGGRIPGDGRRVLKPPFTGDASLYLRACGPSGLPL